MHRTSFSRAKLLRTASDTLKAGITAQSAEQNLKRIVGAPTAVITDNVCCEIRGQIPPLMGRNGCSVSAFDCKLLKMLCNFARVVTQIKPHNLKRTQRLLDMRRVIKIVPLTNQANIIFDELQRRE